MAIKDKKKIFKSNKLNYKKYIFAIIILITLYFNRSWLGSKYISKPSKIERRPGQYIPINLDIDNKPFKPRTPIYFLDTG